MTLDASDNRCEQLIPPFVCLNPASIPGRVVRALFYSAIACIAFSFHSAMAMHMKQRCQCTRSRLSSTPYGGIALRSPASRSPARNCCSSTACYSNEATAHIQLATQVQPLILSALIAASQMCVAICPAHAAAGRYHLHSQLEHSAVLPPAQQQHTADAPSAVPLYQTSQYETASLAIASVELSTVQSLTNAAPAGAAAAVTDQLPPIPTTFPDLPKLQQPNIHQEVKQQQNISGAHKLIQYTSCRRLALCACATAGPGKVAC